jgi:hypothetical protein
VGSRSVRSTIVVSVPLRSPSRRWRTPFRAGHIVAGGVLALAGVLVSTGISGAATYTPTVAPTTAAPTTVITVTADTSAGESFSDAAYVVFTYSTGATETVTPPDPQQDITGSTMEFPVPSDAPAGAATITVYSGVAPGADTPIAFTVTAPLQVTSTSIKAAEATAPYSITLQATGGVGPYTWATAAGATLPTGLTLTSGGLLSGQIASPGQYPVPVTVSDKYKATASVSITLTVASGPAITTTTLPNPVVSSTYSVTFGVTGGTPPYSWSIPTGGLPGGLLLTSSGLLEGRPGVAGSSTITIRVTDAVSASTTVTLPITVSPAPLPTETLGLVSAAGTLVDLSSPAATVTVTQSHVHASTVFTAKGTSGYWVVSSHGFVRGVGIRAYGSVARRVYRMPIVSGASPNAKGYWLVSRSGQVYAFGSAHNYGSIKKKGIDVVAMVVAPNAKGYWLVTSTGAVDSFGSAPRLKGLTARGTHVVSAAAVPSGAGLWLLGRGGQIYDLGSAGNLGQLPKRHAGTPVAIETAQSGSGYWVITRIGAVYGFGSARSLPSIPTGLRVIAAASE